MNLVEKCSREIERIVILREHCRQAPSDTQINFIAAIAIMTAAIDAAHNALGRGDAIAIIEAVRDLGALR